MNRKDFMGRLEELLMDIPTEERVEAMAFYHSYFEDAGEENEERVIRELESPEKVAASIKADMNFEDAGQEVIDIPKEKTIRDEEDTQTGNAWNGGYTQTGNAQKGYTQAENTWKEGYTQAGDTRMEGYTQSGGYRGERKKDDDVLKIVLIVIVAVLTSPIWLGLLGGLLGLIIGALGAVFGIVVAIVAVALSLYLAGIALCGASVAAFGCGAVSIGLGLFGAGLLVLCFAVLSTVLCVWVFGKFVPWAVRGIISGCRKLFRRRPKGGYAE